MDAWRRKACGAIAYGQAVWSCPPDAGVKSAGPPWPGYACAAAAAYFKPMLVGVTPALTFPLIRLLP